jgi:hypothetical protein
MGDSKRSQGIHCPLFGLSLVSHVLLYLLRLSCMFVTFNPCHDLHLVPAMIGSWVCAYTEESPHNRLPGT